MQDVVRDSMRASLGLALLGVWILVAGCSTFDRDWQRAAKQPPAGGLEGRWQGTWQSDANGHNDRLRCLITPSPGGYQARFHAIYRGTFTFSYTVPLHAEETNGVFRFRGEADLGWLAGGRYQYEGQADGTNFFSTYRCKYDHGTFRLERPADSLTNAALPATPLAHATQLVVVTTADWKAIGGLMHRFERPNVGGGWVPVGSAVPVVVGRNGLGWGRGLAPPAGEPADPAKREGDGKSPAGAFRLSSAFGLAPAGEFSGIKLPYRRLTPGVECVDDGNSTAYNSVVDRAAVAHPDWNSSEKMRAIGEPYRLGVMVDHNVDPRNSAGGSCIFLHIWQGSRIGTSGCTAMAGGEMEALIRWLNPVAQPVLVQLPAAEYQRLGGDWSLPQL